MMPSILTDPVGPAPRIAVIGGGYSGAAFALQAVRDADPPPTVTIFEPRAMLGAGLAYSTDDPDHRINAPALIHYALPGGADQFEQWLIDSGRLAADPEAVDEARGLFPRRREFGAHLAELLRPYQSAESGPPPVRHVRALAAEVRERSDAMEVVLEDGTVVAADAVVLATGNRPVAPPPPFTGAVARHGALIASPWDAARLAAIDPAAAVLLLGTGLTTSDVIATLIRQGHRGAITAVSRRGLRPVALPVPPGAAPVPAWDRIVGPMPDFLTEAARAPALLTLLRTVRARIREVAPDGVTWHVPFDELRDSLWELWPSVPIADKRRFMRHLRPWYDTRRFRLPPQTERIVAAAEDRGIVAYRAARAVSAAIAGREIVVAFRDRGSDTVRTETFGAVVNCTGTTAGPGDDPLSRALEGSGLTRPHPSGFGWDVDADCHAIGRDGAPRRRLFIIGPPSAGYFGDPLGSPFILAQIHRMLPGMRATMASGPSAG